MQAKDELENFFSTPPEENIKFNSGNMGKIRKSVSHKIESLHTLKNLIDIKQEAEEPSDLRFLVDGHFKAWFARETHANRPLAPKHYQMTGNLRKQAQCIAAGNLELDKDHTTLIKVNHKSGDFRPSFNSLKWLLAILVLNEDQLPFKLPEHLLIERLNSVGGLEQNYNCPMSLIKEWVQTFQDNNMIDALKTQEKEFKDVSYEPEYQFTENDSSPYKTSNTNSPSTKRKLDFLDSHSEPHNFSHGFFTEDKSAAIATDEQKPVRNRLAGRRLFT